MTNMQRPLRILQVSTSDLGGGAEGSAWNLFQAYRSRGHKSWLAVGHKRSDDPDVLEIPRLTQSVPWSRPCWILHGRLLPLEGRVCGVRRLRYWLRTLAGGWPEIDREMGLEDFNFPGSRSLLQLPPELPDLIHAHNLHRSYFDLRILPWLSHQVPVILNLRDAWLLSGHCAHSFACERWKTGCGHCPDLTIYPAIRRDATAHNWQRKRHIYAKSHLYITAPSQWLMDRVRQSMLQGVEHRVIPNAVDLSVFRPGDQVAAREKLGLPLVPKIIMFAANGIRRNIWKDYATMEAAVRQVANNNQDIELVFLCLGEDAEKQSLGTASILFVDSERDVKRVALYYQASDVYIHAAKAEAFGKTIAEALACGVPVVATAVGGIPEQIEDGTTGFLVPPEDTTGMATSIERLLEDDNMRRRFSHSAAEDARRRFGLERQVDDFLTWYREIIDSWNQEESHALRKPE